MNVEEIKHKNRTKDDYIIRSMIRGKKTIEELSKILFNVIKIQNEDINILCQKIHFKDIGISEEKFKRWYKNYKEKK